MVWHERMRAEQTCEKSKITGYWFGLSQVMVKNLSISCQETFA